MMRKVILISIFAALMFNLQQVAAAVTSNDPVLLKINEREITVSEFEYVYNKNNVNAQSLDQGTLEEYLELFINFNLKVYEALQLKMDTNPAFIEELEGYRKQLAQPYLTDQNVTNQLLEEAYERSLFDIRASHILFNVEKHASPADTLAAWRKALSVRNRILAGESFEKLAKESSDDPSAKGMPATPQRPAIPGNGGDLGYFTVMDMVYPFESAAYKLNVGDVSMPVRTDFGYHLIRLTDKLPAMGRARVAHIMVSFPQDADEAALRLAEEKINEIWKNLQAGEEFSMLAERFSDDKASGRRGGELPAFTSNRMVPEFIKAIAALSPEKPLSGPVKSQYGFHLIRFFEKQLPSKDEAMAELNSRIARDSRSFLSQQMVVERLKKENGFREYDQNLEPFFTLVDNTVFEGNWDNQQLRQSDAVLFSFANQEYKVKDFTNYIISSQGMRSQEAIRSYIGRLYDSYQQEVIMAHEEKNLSQKHPEFKKIMKEYHDGILLFELTDQKVWGKAMSDTSGLNHFYNDNIAQYMWNDRFDAEIYTFSNEATAKAGRKMISKAHKKGLSHTEILEMLNKDSHLSVSAEKGSFEIENYALLGRLKRKKGISKVLPGESGQPVVVWVNKYLPRQPKKLNEIRGLVIADYQNFLEVQWVEELREKYPYVLNREALNALKTTN
jgi:peptidyl-prolyl cis-trans isomerase SurA